MKNSKKITFSAIMAALATVIMLVSYFPYLTYAVPAIAGLCIMVVVIEINKKWALLSYFSAAFLSFLLAEFESMILFVSFFGYYPILKSIIEKLGKPIPEWILKILTFNTAVILVYLSLSHLISFAEMGSFADYAELILLAMGNIVFVLYDIAISRVSWLYFDKFHFRLAKFFK